MNTDYNVIIRAAISARENSYSPYSGFAVGAALLTHSGKIFSGCNIENAAFSPTSCAERTAFFKAVSEGEQQFDAIAIVAGKKGEALCEASPCGVCRQVMREFCSPCFKIILALSESDYRVVTLSELLPHAFGPENIENITAI